MEKEKEKAIIELLEQKKPHSEIEQQLHVSSRDISHTKKKYEEEQNKMQLQSEAQSKVVSSDLHATEQHKDLKCEEKGEMNDSTNDTNIGIRRSHPMEECDKRNSLGSIERRAIFIIDLKS